MPFWQRISDESSPSQVHTEQNTNLNAKNSNITLL